MNLLVLKHQSVIRTSVNVYEICNKKTRYEYTTFPVHFVEIRPCKKDMQNIKVHCNSTMPTYFLKINWLLMYTIFENHQNHLEKIRTHKK